MIKINDKALLSKNHLVQTNNCWIKAKDLKFNDIIMSMDNKQVKITKIIKCGKRPNAPIIGYK